MEKDFQIDEQVRKDVYAFRKYRKEQREKPPVTDPKEIEMRQYVDDILKRAMPNCYKYNDHMEKMANSVWFAISEIERFDIHIKTVHNGKADECEGEGCLDDFSIEDFKEFMNTICNSLVQHLSEDKDGSE